MKKVFISLFLLAALSLLSTLFPINTKTFPLDQQPHNTVTVSTWPWLPLSQFDKYRPLFNITIED